MFASIYLYDRQERRCLNIHSEKENRYEDDSINKLFSMKKHYDIYVDYNFSIAKYYLHSYSMFSHSIVKL
jgi:hypothetical protein